jgi:hypothetical protein
MIWCKKNGRVETNQLVALSTPGLSVVGELDDFSYTAEKQNGGEVCLKLKSKPHYHSDERGDWIKFYAFMAGLALCHGAQAWPYRIEYWRAGRKELDRIRPADRLPRTVHVPFDDRLAFDDLTGRLHWNLQTPLALAIQESHVAGLINILVLKLIGYSGWLQWSACEDKYREI